MHKDSPQLERQTKGMTKILKRLSQGCRVSYAAFAELLPLHKHLIKQHRGATKQVGYSDSF